MRKKLLLLAFVLAITDVCAQNVSVIVTSPKLPKKELKAVDKVLYRVTYNTKAVIDTTHHDSTGYKYRTDVSRLDIGERVSNFYSYQTFLHDSVFAVIRKSGSRDYNSIPRRGALSWSLFRGYPEGKTVYIDRVGRDDYRVEETQETPQWQILSDSTRTLLGYPCTMATATFKGRVWTAWYTEDIPLDNGPWKLCGLPGLILSAADANRQYVFEGAGLRQVAGTDTLFYDMATEKYERVTMKQFNEVQRKFRPADLITSKNIQIQVTGTDGKEAEERMRKVLNATQPCNPIEL